MTKRESHKTVEKFVSTRFDVVAILGLIFAVLSVIFDLPEKETLLGHVVNIQLLATIVSIIGFGVFGAWLFLRIYLFYPTKTMKYEVYITGDVSRIIPEIKIENKEPVKIQDIYVEMIRFSWNKQVWNDVNKFTVGDRFFSVGLSDDRSVARSPIYVKIAEPIGKFTCILLDNNVRHMPLDKRGSEFSKWARYEFVFRITGKFVDKEEI